MSISPARPSVSSPRREQHDPGRARIPALGAAVLLVVNGVIGLLGEVEDHTSGLGLLSEVTAGIAFLAGAVALTVQRPVEGWRGLLWRLAPVGLGIAGLTMIGVPVIGAEPAEWLFLLAVLPTFVGMTAAAILGTGRVWPWWTAVGVALFLPVMFLVPLNSFVMAATWLAVAVGVLGSRPRKPQFRWLRALLDTVSRACL